MTLFSFRKAAERLGIDRSRLSRWAKSGQIAALDLEGQPKISLQEIERFEREGLRNRKPTKRTPPPTTTPGDKIREIKV